MKSESKIAGMNNIVIFCDFDGTITKNDTLDHFLSLYADKNWLQIEELWKTGKIGSKECLTKQLACIDNISENQLNEFTENIEIDEHFIDFVKILDREKIESYIVSDGFDYFINNTLKKHNIEDIEVFSNKLSGLRAEAEEGALPLRNAVYGEQPSKKIKLTPDYPFHISDCKKNSGLCKCEIIKKLKKDKKVVYIGDGSSDMCASHLADILFAKSKLADYCEENNIKHIKFETFKDICEYLYLNLGEEPDVKIEMLV
jgi:2-hydroxy-3-keto-5-methylthiopentenyl-1-phosphate phosphatase